MNTGVQLVVLGMGESRYVDLFSWAQWKYPQQVSAHFQMNHALAHKIYAAADMFLMPSLFEPCGLSQLISLRYGTLPITRETGGLRDTVLSYNEYSGAGNGFTFLNYNAHDMLHVIERAVQIYRDQRDVFNSIAIRAMQGLYGWDQSAGKYLELYKKLMARVQPIGAEAAAPEAVAPVKKTTRKPRAKADGESTGKKPSTRKKAVKAENAAEGEAKPTRRRTTKAEGETAEKKPATRKKATKADDAPAEKKPRAPRKKKTEAVKPAPVETPVEIQPAE